jgi:hypothetical protein
MYMPVFVIRRKKRAKRRKKGLVQVLEDFNDTHPSLVIWLDRCSGELIFSEAVISLEAPT